MAVFVIDNRSMLKAPVEMVWSFFQTHREHPHSGITNVSREELGSNSYIMSYEFRTRGQLIIVKYRGTAYPPLGFAMDFIDGTFKGSKVFHFFVPRGEKTNVRVVAHLTSPTMSDAMAKHAFDVFTAHLFSEDKASIEKAA